MTYPSIETLLAREGGENFFALRQSARSNLPLVIYFFISLLVVISINFALRKPSPALMTVLQYAHPRWLAVVPLLLLLETVRRCYDRLYVFATNKLTKYEGRLSLRYNVSSVKYADIRGIVVEQSFWGRMFNYGDVLLGTSAESEIEVVIEGIIDPYGLAELIEQLRTFSTKLDDPRTHRD